ncbi:hypothetical protein [Kitasatospora mediocidica]|uniref:hypothetical protein n=1 Tax=Kitasatospora mediocidica TaxID=58352 RepID=UPI00055DCDCA|nr:hypothetical protein [Kitasatospora mediocidica]
MSSACAASGPPVDVVRSTDGGTAVGRAAADRPGEPSLLPGPATAPDASGSSGSTGTVDQLLRSQIRAGGLPLPGQATAVPDAFAIAAVLLPTVPAQPSGRGASGPGSSRPSAGSAGGGRDASASASGGAAERFGAIPAARAGGVPGVGLSAEDSGGGAGDGGWGTDPTGRADGAVARPAHPADAASEAVLAARTAGLAASRDSGRGIVGAPGGADADGFGGLAGTGPADGADRGAATGSGSGWTVAARYTAAADPLSAADSQGAVLIPIAAGLLLTGAAMYKHRGLPGGH